MGVAKSQICVRNGTAYRTSRYRTFSAASQSPEPSAIASASSSSGGIHKMPHVGALPYASIIPSSTAKARAKSTTPPRTEAIGTASRGKYTLVMIRSLWTRLFDDWVSPFATNVHGTNPTRLKIGYGTPSEGTRAGRPKNRLNTTIVRTGWMIAHATPNAVWRYRTLMSRHVRKYISSRYSHSSRSWSDTQPLDGRMTTRRDVGGPARPGSARRGSVSEPVGGRCARLIARSSRILSLCGRRTDVRIAIPARARHPRHYTERVVPEWPCGSRAGSPPGTASRLSYRRS